MELYIYFLHLRTATDKINIYICSAGSLIVVSDLTPGENKMYDEIISIYMSICPQFFISDFINVQQCIGEHAAGCRPKISGEKQTD